MITTPFSSPQSRAVWLFCPSFCLDATLFSFLFEGRKRTRFAFFAGIGSYLRLFGRKAAGCRLSTRPPPAATLKRAVIFQFHFTPVLLFCFFISFYVPYFSNNLVWLIRQPARHADISDWPTRIFVPVVQSAPTMKILRRGSPLFHA